MSSIPLPIELCAHMHQDIYTRMFIAVLLIKVKNWKQLRCPFTAKWVNEVWYIHKIKCFTVIGTNFTATHNNMGDSHNFKF